MKTPEELVEDYTSTLPERKLDVFDIEMAFLAGYQARRSNSEAVPAAAPQWISVKDRLPEIPDNDYSNRVLLLRADGFIVIARIEKCVRFVRPLQQALIVETDNGDPIEEFSHWMPLPKPPEE
jgi:hypothetical protein